MKIGNDNTKDRGKGENNVYLNILNEITKEGLNFLLWQENWWKGTGMEINETLKRKLYKFIGIRKCSWKPGYFYHSVYFQNLKNKPGSNLSINLTTSVWENFGNNHKRYGIASDWKSILLHWAEASQFHRIPKTASCFEWVLWINMQKAFDRVQNDTNTEWKRHKLK